MEWLRGKFKGESDRPIFIQVATISTGESQGSGDATASVESNGNGANDTIGVLEKHFRFLYHIGLCPSPVEEVGGSSTWKKVHKVWFCATSLLGVIHTLDGVKYFSGFLTHGNLDQLLLVGFVIIRGLLKVMYIRTVTKYWEKVRGVISRANKLEKKRPQWHFAFSTSVAVAVVVMTFARTLFQSLTIERWTPRAAILQRSLENAYNLFLWKQESFKNETITEKLDEKYGENISLSTVLLGGSGMVIDFCGYLHIYAVLYFALTAAVFMGHLTDDFVGEFPSSSAWKYCYNLQELCHDVSDVFGMLFKLLHLNNTMVIARLLLVVFIKGQYNIFTAMAFIDTVLILATYILASKIANKNTDVKRYVLERSSDKMFINMGTTRVPVSYVMSSLDVNPLGLGRDNMLIDEGFILKFLCIVGSYFVFMEQRKPEN